MARAKRTKIQSTNKTEYDRLRRNIMARLRYREKQGFKVDYTTKPPLNKRPTKRDIEKLSKYTVGLNKYGEVIADKPRSKAIVQTSFKGMIPSKKYTANSNPIPSLNNVKEIELDYVGMVWGACMDLYHRGNNLTFYDLGHFVNDKKLLALSTAWKDGYKQLNRTIDEQIDKHGEEKVNAYYKERFDEISTAISSLLQMVLSEEDEIVVEVNTIDSMLIVPM